MNKLELMGRLVDNVEVKKSKQGKEYGTFTLAVSRKLDKEKTDFIECVVFGNLVKVISEYTEKGNRIIVNGELNIDNYENKDGQKVKTIKCAVNDFYFVDFKAKE